MLFHGRVGREQVKRDLPLNGLTMNICAVVGFACDGLLRTPVVKFSESVRQGHRVAGELRAELAPSVPRGREVAIGRSSR